MNKYYVYIYYDDNNVPFYVGIGSGRRCRDHIGYAKSAIKVAIPRNKLSHKLNKIIKLLLNGLEPTIRFELAGLTLNEARENEVRLISSIGRADLGLGPLTNMTNGGEGVVGRTTMVSPSGESVSILKEDKLAYEELGYIHFNKNRKHSDEVNKRKAAPWTGGKRPEHGAKVKEAAKNGAYKNRPSRGPHSPATLEKMKLPKVKRDGYKGKHWYHSISLGKEICINYLPPWPDTAPGRLPKQIIHQQPAYK